jgi:hypothetical protein
MTRDSEVMRRLKDEVRATDRHGRGSPCHIGVAVLPPPDASVGGGDDDDDNGGTIR